MQLSFRNAQYLISPSEKSLSCPVSLCRVPGRGSRLQLQGPQSVSGQNRNSSSGAYLAVCKRESCRPDYILCVGRVENLHFRTRPNRLRTRSVRFCPDTDWEPCSWSWSHGQDEECAFLPRHWLRRHSGTLQRLTGQDRDFSEDENRYLALWHCCS